MARDVLGDVGKRSLRWRESGQERRKIARCDRDDSRRGDARSWARRICAVLNALRYYWIITKGFRLRPWASPYIRWRLETFFGRGAADLDAARFVRLMWRERVQMKRFLEWVADRRRAQS
jgi:hypothetical protein